MKNLLKIAVCTALTITACAAFAGDRCGCGPGWHRPSGCHDHRGSDGVRLAADIVDLVGASLNCARVITGPAVYTQTVVTQPAIVCPQPCVYPAPVIRCTPPPPPPPPPRWHPCPGHGPCFRR